MVSYSLTQEHNPPKINVHGKISSVLMPWSYLGELEGTPLLICLAVVNSGKIPSPRSMRHPADSRAKSPWLTLAMIRYATIVTYLINRLIQANVQRVCFQGP